MSDEEYRPLTEDDKKRLAGMGEEEMRPLLEKLVELIEDQIDLVADKLEVDPRAVDVTMVVQIEGMAFMLPTTHQGTRAMALALMQASEKILAWSLQERLRDELQRFQNPN